MKLIMQTKVKKTTIKRDSFVKGTFLPFLNVENKINVHNTYRWKQSKLLTRKIRKALETT